MMAHVYLQDNVAINATQELHESTTRVTMSKDLTPGQLSLILGTRGSPDLKVVAMHDVKWFWIEED